MADQEFLDALHEQDKIDQMIVDLALGQLAAKDTIGLEKVGTTDSDGRNFGFGAYGMDRSIGGWAAIQAGALDLVWGDESVPNKGCGQFSIGSGYNNAGSGYATIFTGWDNQVSSNYTIMTGISNTASGEGGQVIGGAGLRSNSVAQGALFGRCNDIDLRGNGKCALQIGVGVGHQNVWPVPVGERAYVGDTFADGFRVYYTGAVEAPTCTIALIDSVGDKALITKEYLGIEVSGELPAVTDGSTDVTLDNLGRATSLKVYKNGSRTVDFTYDEATGVISLTVALVTSDQIIVDYKY